MNNIELSLEVSTTTNPKVMRVFDTSHFTGNVENFLVEVLPANKNSWVTFTVNPGFSLCLNSSNLNYSKASHTASLLELPDGIYEIKQSIKPNLLTVEHYYYLRTVSVKNRYLSLLYKHFSDECKRDKRAFIEETDKLVRIRQYIEAAEYTVNDMHEKEKGIKYYNYLLELINEFENECQCG